MNKITVKRYSEAFKISLVREYETTGIKREELRKKYDIGGSGTLVNWIRKYGKASSQNKMIRVEKLN